MTWAYRILPEDASYQVEASSTYHCRSSVSSSKTLMYFSSTRRTQNRLKGDTSSNQIRACMPCTQFMRMLPGMVRGAGSRPIVSEVTCWTDSCSSRRWGCRSAQEKSVAKQSTDCKVVRCALPIQLSFLTSRNCARRGCSYPPLKHLAPPGTGYCMHWSAGLGCYGNSWLPQLFIFPLQWPTKRCTGSSGVSCEQVC